MCCVGSNLCRRSIGGKRRLIKIDGFCAEASNGSNDSTLCTALRTLRCIRGERLLPEIDVFRREASNTSEDSAFCTASEYYDAFVAKDTIFTNCP